MRKIQIIIVFILCLIIFFPGLVGSAAFLNSDIGERNVNVDTAEDDRNGFIEIDQQDSVQIGNNNQDLVTITNQYTSDQITSVELEPSIQWVFLANQEKNITKTIESTDSRTYTVDMSSVSSNIQQGTYRVHSISENGSFKLILDERTIQFEEPTPSFKFTIDGQESDILLDVTNGPYTTRIDNSIMPVSNTSITVQSGSNIIDIGTFQVGAPPQDYYQIETLNTGTATILVQNNKGETITRTIEVFGSFIDVQIDDINSGAETDPVTIDYSLQNTGVQDFNGPITINSGVGSRQINYNIPSGSTVTDSTQFTPTDRYNSGTYTAIVSSNQDSDSRNYKITQEQGFEIISINVLDNPNTVASSPVAGEGDPDVEVVIENRNSQQRTEQITTSIGDPAVGSQTVSRTLGPGQQETILFDFTTNDEDAGNYNIISESDVSILNKNIDLLTPKPIVDAIDATQKGNGNNIEVDFSVQSNVGLSSVTIEALDSNGNVLDSNSFTTSGGSFSQQGAGLKQGKQATEVRIEVTGVNGRITTQKTPIR